MRGVFAFRPSASRTGLSLQLGGGSGALEFRNGLPKRFFGWKRDDRTMFYFKVRAEGDNVPKLARGMLSRCEDGLDTTLEAMGSRSIHNCVKAIMLANRFAQVDAKPTTPARIGFVPRFYFDKDKLSMRLRVVPLKYPRVDQEPDEGVALRVSARTELKRLEAAVLTRWVQCCAGGGASPVVAAMGAESVTVAVKGAAFALRELGIRKGGARPFLCWPWAQEVSGVEQEDGPRTVTYLGLEAHSLAATTAAATRSTQPQLAPEAQPDPKVQAPKAQPAST